MIQEEGRTNARFLLSVLQIYSFSRNQSFIILTLLEIHNEQPVVDNRSYFYTTFYCGPLAIILHKFLLLSFAGNCPKFSQLFLRHYKYNKIQDPSILVYVIESQSLISTFILYEFSYLLPFIQNVTIYALTGI